MHDTLLNNSCYNTVLMTKHLHFRFEFQIIIIFFVGRGGGGGRERRGGMSFIFWENSMKNQSFIN